MKPVSATTTYDLIIIGAGLSGLSLAYRLHFRHPNLSFLILEKEKVFNCNKTWSFHHDDIDDIEFWKKLTSHSWPAYEVYFSYERKLEQPYFTIKARDFFQKVSLTLGESLQLNSEVADIENNIVRLIDGREFYSNIILDSRDTGVFPEEILKAEKWGYQKFLGLELKLKKPHNLKFPRLMDARVKQKEGYRFIYTLPYSEDTLLIEDTRYSDTSSINLLDFKNEILNYAQINNWDIEQILHEEMGCLPIPTRNPKKKIDFRTNSVLEIGTRAGLYHPVTGYTFLWATRLADKLSSLEVISAANFKIELQAVHHEHSRNQNFYILLNKLMFFGAKPELRFKIFDRFYKLSDGTIRRFYASRTNWFDKLRLLIGKPPIPIKNAIIALNTSLEYQHDDTPR